MMTNLETAPETKRLAVAGAAALALVWAGMLIGVSFLATPAKFMAPSLSLPVALDVGRQTFGIFSRVEIGAAILFLIATAVSKHSWLIAIAIAAALMVAGQVLWLLPILDSRVEMILQGEMPAPSNLHMVYIVIDGLKLLVLLAAAGLALRRV